MQFAKKSLGQNFLIDHNVVNKILNLIRITNKNIIEIGPGRGALTEKILLKKPKSLLLIEKDNFLYNELKEKYQNNKIIKIINFDILKFNLEKITKKNTVIFGNLPFNISSQILVKLIKNKKWPPNYSDLIFMFQKEVAEKIIGKSYGRLSIITASRLNVIQSFNVSPNCFFPKPKIVSTVIHFNPKKKLNYKIDNLNSLEKVTNIFFSNKRKMINKSLRNLLAEEQLDEFKDISFNSRPSELKAEFYYKVAELFEKK
jgi:16S rRNA (adenine1518-N6/adenine1519-N6)-dimethyltransferase